MTATNAPLVTTIDAFRKDAWIKRGLHLPYDWPTRTLDWRYDYTRRQAPVEVGILAANAWEDVCDLRNCAATARHTDDTRLAVSTVTYRHTISRATC